MNFAWQGETLHYADEGAGPALVLLHGLGGNADNWVLQRRAFAGTHRVLALDLPGHGRSSGRDIPFTEYWRAIAAMLDHADIASATLCGLSKGARAGLAFAARRPARVDGMIVINAFLHLSPEDRARRLALYDLLLEAGGPVRWAEQLLAMMGVADRPAIVRGFLKSRDHIDPVHIRRIFGQLDAYDQRPELADIGCPVLLVRGARDGFVPGYCVQDLHAGLSDSRIVAMQDAGHLPYLEDPAGFNRILAGFLEELEKVQAQA